MLDFMSRAETAARASDVMLPRGVRLRYIDQGPPSGHAIVMLHGLTDSSFSFSRVLPLLPGTARVIVPDQRGHGDSDRPESGYTMNDFALDALELMDALQIARATVVGHSMGSFVARRMARLAPGRVAQLVLIGTAPSANNVPVRELAAALEGMSDPLEPAFVRDFQKGASGPGVPAEFLDRAVAESLKLPLRVWKAALAATMADLPEDDRITCDTLVLGGGVDAIFTVSEQRDVARRIRGAKIHIIPGIGHSLHWEAPELFVAAMR